jgi:hypothetical protein
MGREPKCLTWPTAKVSARGYRTSTEGRLGVEGRDLAHVIRQLSEQEALPGVATSTRDRFKLNMSIAENH